MIKRKITRTIKIGNVKIGFGNPIAIQTMTKTRTSDVKRTLREIKELESLGCDIVRLAIKDISDAEAIKKIKKETNLPLVGDIHFDWKLAISAIENGVDKIRINPGNIKDKIKIKEIVKLAKSRKIPIRIGLNAGSIDKAKIVKTALDYTKLLEDFGFFDIVLSLKLNNVLETIDAYRKISLLCDYPLHLGLTATGIPEDGLIKSSVCLGILLSEGIGDTIRVSLTDKPQREVIAGKSILKSLGLQKNGIEVISCPTCGRCDVNLIKLVKNLEDRLSKNPSLNRKNLKVAVMGCIVNGPGEAKEADLGLAFSKNKALFFKEHKPIKKIDFNKSLDFLCREIKN
ncbi:MAG: flavodoxin-dependent (E)-4-hydroxy-3-methylbut-2-enyl-diphosphate synthase [Candidatus Omnitrophota bacterium]